MHRPRTAVLLAALIAAAPAVAAGQAGTVTFAPTGDGGPVTPIFSGPALTQSGAVRSGFGGAASTGATLLSWQSPQYSGGPAVYGNSSIAGDVAEYALSVTAGTRLAFDAASFGGYSNTARFVRIRLYDLTFTQLFDQILSVPTSPQAVVNFGGVSTTSGTLRMQFTEVTAAGAASGRGPFDVGFSSLSYFVGPRAAVVPEPSTYLLVAVGLAGVGAAARRRARA